MLSGCGEDVPYEAFSFESFAFMLEDEHHWEVNTSVQVHGFEQREENDTYTAHLSYTVDLTFPSGKVKKGIATDSKELTFKEDVIDAQLTPQFNLVTEEAGLFKLTIVITDEYTGMTTSIKSEFEIEHYESEPVDTVDSDEPEA
jgi:hypothetical protein